jgi:hypothetical protein
MEFYSATLPLRIDVPLTLALRIVALVILRSLMSRVWGRQCPVGKQSEGNSEGEDEVPT